MKTKIEELEKRIKEIDPAIEPQRLEAVINSIVKEAKRYPRPEQVIQGFILALEILGKRLLEIL